MVSAYNNFVKKNYRKCYAVAARKYGRGPLATRHAMSMCGKLWQQSGHAVGSAYVGGRRRIRRRVRRVRRGGKFGDRFKSFASNVGRVASNVGRTALNVGSQVGRMALAQRGIYI